MKAAVWYLLLGVLLLLMTVSSGWVKRLPVSTSLLYLIVGTLMGVAGLGTLSAHDHAAIIERVTEAAVIVSLFTTGLKLKPHGEGRSWAVPVRLASVSMLVTIAGLTAIGVGLMGLPLGAALVLGAVLAPTDPVLASDVQLQKAKDEEPVRHSLTAEAGLNDGSAFPFVMLGLGLLELHDLGASGWKWWALDLLWAVMGGLLVGFVLGHAVGRLVLYLRLRHQEALGLDEFLTLGLIAVAYGLAVVLKAYGFLAVFSAGLALRRFEVKREKPPAAEDVRAAAEIVDPSPRAATHPERAHAYMADATLAFNEKLERILELGVMVMVGMLLAGMAIPWHQLWFVALLLFVVRPLAVTLALLGSKSTALERGFMAWFGIRGIGSLYYLFYAASHGLGPEWISKLSGITLLAIAASVVLHGVSVTPLMRWYAVKTRGTASN